jgi:hypothetical protein
LKQLLVCYKVVACGCTKGSWPVAVRLPPVMLDRAQRAPTGSPWRARVVAAQRDLKPVDALRREARTDVLTGLLNRRAREKRPAGAGPPGTRGWFAGEHLPHRYEGTGPRRILRGPFACVMRPIRHHPGSVTVSWCGTVVQDVLVDSS